MDEALDVVRRLERIVPVFEEEGKSEAQKQTDDKAHDEVVDRVRLDGRSGSLGVVHDPNVVVFHVAAEGEFRDQGEQIAVLAADGLDLHLADLDVLQDLIQGNDGGSLGRDVAVDLAVGFLQGVFFGFRDLLVFQALHVALQFMLQLGYLGVEKLDVAGNVLVVVGALVFEQGLFLGDKVGLLGVGLVVHLLVIETHDLHAALDVETDVGLSQRVRVNGRALPVLVLHVKPDQVGSHLGFEGDLLGEGRDQLRVRRPAVGKGEGRQRVRLQGLQGVFDKVAAVEHLDLSLPQGVGALVADPVVVYDGVVLRLDAQKDLALIDLVHVERDRDGQTGRDDRDDEDQRRVFGKNFKIIADVPLFRFGFPILLFVHSGSGLDEVYGLRNYFSVKGSKSSCSLSGS